MSAPVRRRVKKKKHVVKDIITGIFVVIAVVMMVFTIISATTLDRNDRSLFGFKLLKVLSDSMSATDFSAGDLIIVKQVDPTTLKEGDIISFYSRNEGSVGETITHKIREIKINGVGEMTFTTYGTTTNTNDESPVQTGEIYGKYCGKIPGAGYFFEFMQTPAGYVICILLPFMLLILSNAISSVRLFKKYKKEQNAEIQAERNKLEAEKAETQRMMEEIMALKSQLNAQIQQNNNNNRDNQN